MHFLYIVFILLLTLPGSSADIFDWIDKTIQEARKMMKVMWTGIGNGWMNVQATISNLTGVVEHFNETYWLEYLGNGTWRCGTKKIWPTKVIAKMLAQAMCLDVMDDLNEACIVHDDCYAVRNLTRLDCDIEFCNALKVAKENLTPLQRLRCQSPEIFCRAVVHTSHWLYRDWNKTTTSSQRNDTGE